jgi:hypothetical protein
MRLSFVRENELICADGGAGWQAAQRLHRGCRGHRRRQARAFARQMSRDALKFFRKQALVPEPSSWIFRADPYVAVRIVRHVRGSIFA